VELQIEALSEFGVFGNRHVPEVDVFAGEGVATESTDCSGSSLDVARSRVVRNIADCVCTAATGAY
jgi:hypothetical protein